MELKSEKALELLNALSSAIMTVIDLQEHVIAPSSLLCHFKDYSYQTSDLEDKKKCSILRRINYCTV